MIVVDASTIAKYNLKEEDWTVVEKYWLTNDVYSLDLMLKEVLNAIWKNHVLFGNITSNVAYNKKDILPRLVEEKIIHVEPGYKYLNRTFEIALNEKITIYDSLYIAQAEKLKAVLVTSDYKQAETAKRLGVEVDFIP